MAIAMTKVENPPDRWWPFTYFEQAGENGVYSESIAPGTRFRLKEIRLHFSTAFASTEDFTIAMSSVNGSYFNFKLLSQALNTVRDLIWRPDQPLDFFSDDQIVLGLSQVSAVNLFGIEVHGWSIVG